MVHADAEPARERTFTHSRFEHLQQVWEWCCAQEGTVVTDASPWAYLHKHMLMIGP